MPRFLGFLSLIFLFCGCTNPFDAFNPYAYAPENPNSSWTPVKKNHLISSQYCDMLLPNDFDDNEITLGEIIDIALNNNPQTKITWAEARSKAALFGQSLSPYFPSVTGGGQYKRIRASSQAAAEATVAAGSTVGLVNFYVTIVTPKLNVSYTLFDFGERRSSSEAARQALYYADMSHNQEIQTVIQTVMQDYYDYLFQQEQLTALEADLATASETLDAAKQKHLFGVADLGDVSQAKTKFLQAKINSISQKRAVETAFAKLATDSGLPANMAFVVKPLPDRVYVSAVLDSVEDLIEQAQFQRQDFLAARARVKESEAKVTNAKSQFMPVVTGDFEMGRKWFVNFFSEKLNWDLTFKVTGPLFRGAYYRNGLRNAKSQLQKSTYELLDKELSIIEDVTTSHFDVGIAGETLEYTEEYLEEAKEQYDIAISNYRAGVNTILDVLSAQSSVADARSKLADSKRDWYVSLANLAYSTGALCTPTHENGQCGI